MAQRPSSKLLAVADREVKRQKRHSKCWQGVWGTLAWQDSLHTALPTMLNPNPESHLLLQYLAFPQAAILLDQTAARATRHI